MKKSTIAVLITSLVAGIALSTAGISYALYERSKVVGNGEEELRIGTEGARNSLLYLEPNVWSNPSSGDPDDYAYVLLRWNSSDPYTTFEWEIESTSYTKSVSGFNYKYTYNTSTGKMSTLIYQTIDGYYYYYYKNDFTRTGEGSGINGTWTARIGYNDITLVVNGATITLNGNSVTDTNANANIIEFTAPYNFKYYKFNYDIAYFNRFSFHRIAWYSEYYVVEDVHDNHLDAACLTTFDQRNLTDGGGRSTNATHEIEKNKTSNVFRIDAWQTSGSWWFLSPGSWHNNTMFGDSADVV